MHSFEHLVAEIREELRLRGLEHSSLIFTKLAQQYAPYYQSFEPERKEALLLKLKALERSVGLQKPFDWESALSTKKNRSLRRPFYCHKSTTGQSMNDKLTLAVNHALNDARMARARMGLMAPTMGLDNKRHSAWCEYGFPEQVTYENLYALYRRGGIAHGAVEKLVGKCWQTNPEIIEGDQADKKRKETASGEKGQTGIHQPILALIL